MSEIDKYKNDEMVYLTDCGVIWHTDTVEQRLKAENDKYKQCLDEIEETVKDFHLSMIIFHKGTTHEMADRIDYYLDEIKQLIKQAKEGANG